MTPDLHVLLVEDNEADVLLVEEALRDDTLPVRLHVAWNGVEALSRLDGELLPTPPRLVLLDANMPRMDALEVLSELRRDPRWALLPVVVYSSSSDPFDAARAYRAGANAYVAKPVGLDDFIAVVRDTVRFWSLAVPVAWPTEEDAPAPESSTSG